MTFPLEAGLIGGPVLLLAIKYVIMSSADIVRFVGSFFSFYDGSLTLFDLYLLSASKLGLRLLTLFRHCCGLVLPLLNMLIVGLNIKFCSYLLFNIFNIFCASRSDLSLSAMFVSSVVFLVSYVTYSTSGPISHLHHNTLGT